MMVNRKFEREAAYRSRLALLLTLLLHLGLAAFILLRNGEVKLQTAIEKKEIATPSVNRP